MLSCVVCVSGRVLYLVVIIRVRNSLQANVNIISSVNPHKSSECPSKCLKCIFFSSYFGLLPALSMSDVIVSIDRLLLLLFEC